MKRRGSGILLHISSLPSPYGIGDLGPAAYQFADFLARSKQTYWQVLPLSPTHLGGGSSPYNSRSAFAGNPWLISIDLLVEEGLLAPEEVPPFPDANPDRVDFPAVVPFKERLFDLAFERFQAQKPSLAYEEFCSKHARWLEDYCRFTAIATRYEDAVWSDWPPGVRDRNPDPLKALDKEIFYRKEREKFLQFVFFRQWFALKEYCNVRGIQIIGDMPIYVQYHSADLWTVPQLFKLDEAKKPRVVAGVPPDYFSSTGQLWGNPIYDWEVLRQTGFDWWIHRMSHNARLYDWVRVDHFLGLVAYWEVPAGEETAINGKWVEAPAEELLQALFRKVPLFPMIAEDLGVVTPAVREVLRRFDIPGMKILLFAFGDSLATNPYVPHNHISHCILYTGTHDNNTVRGWFEHDASPADRERLFRYLGRELSADEVSGEMIRLAMMSVADAVIFPFQDLLGLGAEGRMNIPSTAEGNWVWRARAQQIDPSLEDWLRQLTETYGRA
jgi:4-alpha-glucanotransferase